MPEVCTVCIQLTLFVALDHQKPQPGLEQLNKATAYDRTQPPYEAPERIEAYTSIPYYRIKLFNLTRVGMGPIRRYLRVSKYTVLECRIYLENPSDSRWLLDSHDATLKRVIESIRPLVQPKLREEKERIKAKKKSKPVKDVLVEGQSRNDATVSNTDGDYSVINNGL